MLLLPRMVVMMAVSTAYWRQPEVEEGTAFAVYKAAAAAPQRLVEDACIPVAEQNLMFLEEELNDFHTLEDYNIKDSCTVRLSVGMKGGPINARRTLYLDDKNTITEMAKMLAANDVDGEISVVLVPHNGSYHVIPVPSLKRERDANAPSCSRERRRVNAASNTFMYVGSQNDDATGDGMGGRRSEENKATKNKMAALQKQLKEKRAAPTDPQPSAGTGASIVCSNGNRYHGTALIAPALLRRQSGQCCASNLQNSILPDAMPPAAASSVLVGAGVAGAEPPRKVVVPRLLTAHNTISLNVNELNSAQSLASYACAATAASGAGDGGGAFEASSSYSSGVERNLVLYPSAGPSGSAGNAQGETIFVSPYKGLFRCTADTTENASKEDVSSGTGRCSSAAAAPPPADNSPTVVERPPAVGSSQQAGQGPAGPAGSPPPSSSGLGAAKAQLLPSQVTPGVGTQPTPNKNHAQQQQQQQQQQQPQTDDVSLNKDEVKVERPSEEVACAPISAGTQSGNSCTDVTSTAFVAFGGALTPAPPKKKHPRCAVCNKKTGLASSYTCRCGGNFCATHRYAEAHECGHDYKTEGRQLLEKSNPLIQAAKLQKI
ncbi:hypothetical protein BIW11_06535 [Tropilaelaps mercedesae]|uniref:AN1-type zinc finger protein 4-like n=1 Tax=Tropilaelaps mercedesae TaxID=418985 RepID=A0A1V9XXL6_9ACAR|nr:hypothetical protein BIW11_06535 [Tropilaelaps mercedesae]